MLVSFNIVLILGINDLKLILLSEISDARFGHTLTKCSSNFLAIVFSSFISMFSIIIF